MLARLQVRDFAIVDRISVEFEQGMTVLTGETGAGKSILVDALGLVLGERGNAQLVRSGAKRAEFSAEFKIDELPQAQSWLEEQALDADGECLLRRVIGADGRSRAFINGNAVPVQQLKTLGEYLVDIHGQHFHQSLGKASVQRDLLDHYGELLELRTATADAYTARQALAEELEQLQAADRDRDSRLDLVGFQLQELLLLDTSNGEHAALLEERQRLQNSGRLFEGVAHASQCLSNDDGDDAAQRVADAARAVAGLLDFDPSLGAALELLESAGIQINEAADQLQRYVDDIDMDPARRDQVEERLDALQAIARKHRVEADALPDLVHKLQQEHDQLQNSAARGLQLEQALTAADARYREAAEALSEGRRSASGPLAEAVTKAMHELGMPGGQFDISLQRRASSEARVHGLDELQFLLSANPGQPPQALAKVASGGELSRMSLAIQVIVSGGSSIPTMVFDEVDSGVGGGVAEMVGRRLAELGKSRQVLCVTHLAQVASLASQHFRIAKVTDGKATRTSVQALSRDERVDELARMIGGVDITTTTLAHAAEMLDGAPKKRA